jgi:hypothetical protein
MADRHLLFLVSKCIAATVPDHMLLNLDFLLSYSKDDTVIGIGSFLFKDSKFLYDIQQKRYK